MFFLPCVDISILIVPNVIRKRTQGSKVPIGIESILKLQSLLLGSDMVQIERGAKTQLLL